MKVEVRREQMDSQGGKLRASLCGTRSDTATVLHMPSLNEGCVCPNAFPTGHVTAGWVWPGAWPGEQQRQSSLTSWSCDWE